MIGSVYLEIYRAELQAGRADILSDGEEHDRAQDHLCLRYQQYRGMNLTPLPVIAVRISRVLSWGVLS